MNDETKFILKLLAIMLSCAFVGMLFIILAKYLQIQG